MPKRVLELVIGRFRVRVGAGKSGQNLEFVCTTWRHMNCRQVTHQAQTTSWFCFALDFWVWLS